MLHAHTYWAALTGAFATGFLAREIPEVAKAQGTKDVGTYSMWWRRMLGLDPWHWRCLILAPVFGLFWTWFQLHILLDSGPKIATVKRWLRVRP